MKVDKEQLAREAYEAYGEVTDFKNFQGNPMPKWDDLTEKIREAWQASVYRTASLVKAGWMSELDERQQKMINDAIKYAENPYYSRNHDIKMLMAKLAQMLDRIL